MTQPITHVSPGEARQLLSQGYVPLDVRSEQEFELGHLPGARNIPLMQPDGDRLQDNPMFLAVAQKRLSKDTPLLVSCRSGNRSLRACHLLLESGYTRELIAAIPAVVPDGSSS